MKDQVTTIEQWEQLKKVGVPAKKASMCWVKDPNENKYNLAVHDESCYEMAGLEPIPAYTVADLLGIMKPVTMVGIIVNPCLERLSNNDGWAFEFGSISEDEDFGYARDKSLINLLVSRIEWIVSNRYKLNV